MTGREYRSFCGSRRRWGTASVILPLLLGLQNGGAAFAFVAPGAGAFTRVGRAAAAAAAPVETGWGEGYKTVAGTRVGPVARRRPRSSHALMMQVIGGDTIKFEPPEEEGAAPTGVKEDHLISVLSGNGEVLVKAVTARNLVQEAVVRLDLSTLASDALGRTLVCTLMVANGLKDEETLQFTFEGRGPLKSVMAISDSDGGVRGFVGDGTVELPLNKNGRPDVSAGIGKGLLKVVRMHPDYERPYGGITALRNSEVAFDVAGYLKESDQKSCAIAAGCLMQGAAVRQAGGWMVETLPFASEETSKTLLENIQRLMDVAEDPSQLIADGLSPALIAEELLKGLGGLGKTTVNRPEYRCSCSNDRVERAMRLLGEEELKDMVLKQENIEVMCEFCGTQYVMTPNDIVEKFDLKMG